MKKDNNDFLTIYVASNTCAYRRYKKNLKVIKKRNIVTNISTAFFKSQDFNILAEIRNNNKTDKILILNENTSMNLRSSVVNRIANLTDDDEKKVKNKQNIRFITDK